ncbi:MAG: hypothetical protein ACI86M_000300 [Saprospiraceae bacterium]|jgi:hypothetical protein
MGMKATKLIPLNTLANFMIFIVLGTISEGIRYLYRHLKKKEQKRAIWFEILESSF